MSIKKRLEIAKALEKFYPNGFFDNVEKEETKEIKEDIDYSSMTVSELKAIAKEKEISQYYKLKKSELIEALNALE